MPDLASPSKTIEILKKHNFSLKKKFGQNFLIDHNILNKIITTANINKSDCILEIGPGIGTMTQYLAEHAGKVIAVEIDRTLIPILEETLSGYDNVTIINQDILKIDIQKLVEVHNENKPIKVVANLPYYITTPIIMSLFEQDVPLESLTILVQKEVAERIKSGPGSKEYGALSLAVQYYAKPEIAVIVPPTCFIPKPKVSSAVVHLRKHQEPTVNVCDEIFLFKIIRAAFNQRRKTLANAITHEFKNTDDVSINREDVVSVLKEMGLSESVRGEALTLEEFAILAKKLPNFC